MVGSFIIVNSGRHCLRCELFVSVHRRSLRHNFWYDSYVLSLFKKYEIGICFGKCTFLFHYRNHYILFILLENVIFSYIQSGKPKTICFPEYNLNNNSIENSINIYNRKVFSHSTIDVGLMEKSCFVDTYCFSKFSF